MDNKNIEVIRHSMSHILASAVLKLFPDTKLGIGPSIDNGFYYDFVFSEKISENDFAKITEEMKKIINSEINFEKEEISKEDAISRMKEMGQDYKVELISDLEDGSISFYKTGDFVDLCRGPHIENTKYLKSVAWEIDKLAGAYFKGDEKNIMMTRIYVLCFSDRKELSAYKKMMEEAKRRDHRVIGKEMDLFHIDPIVGLGLPMWFPNGAMLWRVIEDFWYKEHIKAGYELVRTPHIGNRKLWEMSGHWGFYSDSMYPPIEVSKSLEEAKNGENVDRPKEEYLLKPMNCPFHVMLYKARPKSYKDLPIRWAECGTVYRYEKSGEISGLSRVRGFTQDDAHIICDKDQVKSELMRVLDFIKFIFNSFGFSEYKVYLSMRDPNNKEKYAGNDEGWEFTQRILEEVANEKELDYIKEEGEAAFYGPKLDFKVKDCIGREWQCSTLQFDFNLPERFDMEFTNAKGEKERPYMLHRALFGSFERFMGILIENYEGKFPFWFSPNQIDIVPVSNSHIEYAKKVRDLLLDNNFRVKLNEEDDALSAKIKKSTANSVPFIIIIGDKEIENNSVSLRERGNKETIEKKMDEIVEFFNEKNKH